MERRARGLQRPHRGAWCALLDELGVAPAQAEFWRLNHRPAEHRSGPAAPRPRRGLSPRRTASPIGSSSTIDGFRAVGCRQSVASPRSFDELATQRVPCAVATSATRMDTDQLLGPDRAAGAIRGGGSPPRDVRRGKPDRRCTYGRPVPSASSRGTAWCSRTRIVGVQAARRAGMRVIGVTDRPQRDRAAGGRRRACRGGFRGESNMASVSTPRLLDRVSNAGGGDGWELRQPAPPLVDFVERTPPPRGRVAVPGLWRGHDVRYLAGHGYGRRVGFDFSRRRRSPRRRRSRRPSASRPNSVRGTSSTLDRELRARVRRASGSTRASARSNPRRRTDTSGR